MWINAIPYQSPNIESSIVELKNISWEHFFELYSTNRRLGQDPKSKSAQRPSLNRGRTWVSLACLGCLLINDLMVPQNAQTIINPKGGLNNKAMTMISPCTAGNVFTGAIPSSQGRCTCLQAVGVYLCSRIEVPIH